MAASTSDSDDIISGINITPLVDIVLVILIIFIVTASFVLRSNIPLQLPKAQSSEPTSGGLLNVAVTKDGQVWVNGKPSDLDGVARAVSERRAQAGEHLNAFVSADVGAPYGSFAQVVDRLRVEGVTEIAMDTRPPEAREATP